MVSLLSLKILLKFFCSCNTEKSDLKFQPTHHQHQHHLPPQGRKDPSREIVDNLICAFQSHICYMCFSFSSPLHITFLFIMHSSFICLFYLHFCVCINHVCSKYTGCFNMFPKALHCYSNRDTRIDMQSFHTEKEFC